jgi:phosphomethylpyrimidine synthase
MRKVYIQGSRPDIRVPVDEVVQSPTRSASGDVANPPLRRYDTSGPHSEPDARIAVEDGLPPLRHRWVVERDDVDLVRDSGRAVLRARDSAAVTQLHYARRGLVTPEM